LSFRSASLFGQLEDAFGLIFIILDLGGGNFGGFANQALVAASFLLRWTCDEDYFF
jgi:hypothetical protein